MSYGFKIKNTDGTLAVTEAYGDVPADLALNVVGHQAPEQVSVGVSQLDTSGKIFCAAHATRSI